MGAACCKKESTSDSIVTIVKPPKEDGEVARGTKFATSEVDDTFYFVRQGELIVK